LENKKNERRELIPINYLLYSILNGKIELLDFNFSMDLVLISNIWNQELIQIISIFILGKTNLKENQKLTRRIFK